MKFDPKEVVDKPWGKEIWLELNDKYCFKQIEINKGHQTSYQYHEYKKETICMISGEATLLYESLPVRGRSKRQLKPGDSFTVSPGDRHRMIADTDIVFLEASTSEVWDVVRIEDDYSRK